jgi:ActR/RegA family two-component response regulator
MTDVLASFKGRRLFVVEDDYFIVEELLRGLEQAGMEVVGPVPNLGQAMVLLGRTQHLDGAILDISLQGEMVFPLADALQSRNIPFVFLTGYEPAMVPARFKHIRHCDKSVDLVTLITALFHEDAAPKGVASSP